MPFLTEKTVTYTVVYADRQTLIDNRVNGYPTIVLLDSNKKIIHQHTGYGAAMEREPERIILEHL